MGFMGNHLPGCSRWPAAPPPSKMKLSPRRSARRSWQRRRSAPGAEQKTPAAGELGLFTKMWDETYRNHCQKATHGVLISTNYWQAITRAPVAASNGSSVPCRWASAFMSSCNVIQTSLQRIASPSIQRWHVPPSKMVKQGP